MTRLQAARSRVISASEAARALLLAGVVSASGLVKLSVPTPATCTTCGWSLTLALSTWAPTGRSCWGLRAVRSISPAGALLRWAAALPWAPEPPPAKSATRPSAPPATSSATRTSAGPRAKNGVLRGIFMASMSCVTSPIRASDLRLDQGLARSRRQLEHHSLSQAAVAELEIDVQPARQLVQDRDARGHEPHALGVEVDARGHLVAGGAREQLEGALEGPPAELRPHDAAHRGGAAADGDGAVGTR